jgi:hypothetical protein
LEGSFPGNNPATAPLRATAGRLYNLRPTYTWRQRLGTCGRPRRLPQSSYLRGEGSPVKFFGFSRWGELPYEIFRVLLEGEASPAKLLALFSEGSLPQRTFRCSSRRGDLPCEIFAASFKGEASPSRFRSHRRDFTRVHPWVASSCRKRKAPSLALRDRSSGTDIISQVPFRETTPVRGEENHASVEPWAMAKGAPWQDLSVS